MLAVHCARCRRDRSEGTGARSSISEFDFNGTGGWCGVAGEPDGDFSVDFRGVIQGFWCHEGFSFIDVIDKLKNNKSDGPLFTPRIPFVVAAVIDSLHNAKSDLEVGDQIVKLNGNTTSYVDQIFVALNENKSQTIDATVLRNGETLNLTLNVSPKGTLGILRKGFSYNTLEQQGLLAIDKVDYSFGEAAWAGFAETKIAFIDYFKQFKRIINPETKAYKSVGGLIKMVEIFPSSWDWRYFWNITAMLSTMLAVLNILPIPALDGGHIVFLLYEMVSGRKPSQRVLETAQMIGIMILLSLLLLANGNDVLEKILG